MSSTLASLQTSFWQAREYLSPVLKDSKFKESGRITPDEFVAAGDYLVYKFPTWQWEGGEVSKKRDYLPSDKQYLIQRNVPCLRRVSQLAYGSNGADDDTEEIMSFALAGGDTDDDWVATHVGSGGDNPIPRSAQSIGDIPDDASPDHQISSLTTSLSTSHLDDSSTMPNMDEIPDMDDENDVDIFEEEQDDAVLERPIAEITEAGDNANLIQVRTYDCSITYDKYYQTPRMWLLGYDEQKRPLPPTTALSDVSADHALKTVTIEPFPHSSLSMASVHPCKHSAVMKRFIERMDAKYKDDSSKPEGSKRSWLGKVKKSKSSTTASPTTDEEGFDSKEGLRVDQYLVVFLKFMSSIVPTIEVDATNAV